MANNENESNERTELVEKWAGLSRGAKLAVILIGVLVLVGVVSGIGGMGDNTASQNVKTRTDEVAAEPTKKEPEVAKTWQKVAELSGSNSKRGDVFTLTGAKARLTYTLSGDYTPTLNVYIVDEGDSLEESGGFPEVFAAKSNGDTLLAKKAGNYYLDVTSTGVWSVTIEEYK